MAFWMYMQLRRLGRLTAGAARQEGATLVEYALLLALIATICIVAVSFLGEAANDRFSAVGKSLTG